MREKILFDENWLFHDGEIEVAPPLDKTPVYLQAKTETMLWGPAAVKYHVGSANDFTCTDFWESVTLPHDYIIKQEPKKHNNNTLGYFDYHSAWYRKEFTIEKDDADKRITLLFEGIAVHSTIYLNGCVLKRNFCGYNSFVVDITDFVVEGKNILAVHVDTSHHEGWWYEGGGIYRHVYMYKTPKTAIELWGIFAQPKKLSETSWALDVQTEILNDDEQDSLLGFKTQIFDKNGCCVAEQEGIVNVPSRQKAIASSHFEIENPDIWDIEEPNLYTAKTLLFQNQQSIDCETTRFGFRTYHLDPEKGFFLNGKHIKIKGVCGHQDFGLTGKAVPDNIFAHKARLMKEMGANGYRTSHYPQPEALMDALDELGFIVMDEVRWFSSSDEGMEQLDMLIKRDRNRPSIFFWSVGNEEPHHTTEVGRKICKRMMSRVRQLDSSRTIITAVCHSPDIATVYDELDAIGINYNLDKYDYVHSKYPDKAVFASECCATGTTRGWYYDDCPERGYLAAYDKDSDFLAQFYSRERTWKFLCEREWILGGYQWIAFEHRGETVWPRLCSQSGAIDLYLQKKDAFYQNQSHWLDTPMVHLLPHWNFDGRQGDIIRVVAYTNCTELELYLNGKSLGKKAIEKYGHGEWEVAYEPGAIRVEARIDGKTVCVDERITTGKPQALLLTLENTIKQANGRDIALITCSCIDSEGRIVPDASPFVSFNSNSLGKIVGTGSDVCDHVPVTESSRKMRAGAISVAVMVGKTAGTLKVYAESEGLKSAVLSIELEN